MLRLQDAVGGAVCGGAGREERGCVSKDFCQGIVLGEDRGPLRRHCGAFSSSFSESWGYLSSLEKDSALLAYPDPGGLTLRSVATAAT